MIRYTVNILSVLGLAVLVYFIGIPGCSMEHMYGGLTTLSCKDMPEDSNCISFIDQNPTPGGESPEGFNRRRKMDDRPQLRTRTPQHRIKTMIYNISLGKVDILFVIDNSSSMAVEHRNIASQFERFLNKIRDVDYHIAVITTDISSSPDNPAQNKYYQDGRFIPIGGRIFLENENMGQNPSPSVINAFKQAIEREETKRCDPKKQPSNSGSRYDQLYEGEVSSIPCPSSDERGIYAVNRALRNTQHRSFWRNNAHLIIVIVSDEDIRSGKEYYGQPGKEMYKPEQEDTPKSLVDNFYDLFSNSMRQAKTKTFSVHSIIIPPGDSDCMNKQSRFRSRGEGRGRGYYGREYARLSRADDSWLTQHGNLLEGDVISICKRSYGDQLQKVAVSAETIRLALPCATPTKYDFFVNGKKIKPRHRKIEGRTLIMEPGEIKLNSRIEAQVSCREN